MKTLLLALLLLTMILSSLVAGSALAAQDGQLELRVIDNVTGNPIPVRMHLRDAQGKAVIPKGKIVSWRDHFVFPGKILLNLKPGAYQFTIERGPEYHVRTGHFELKRRDADAHEVTMERFADLKQEGWWSGDLHIHRPPKDIELLMLAEDLNVAPVITWWNDQDQWKDQPLPDPPLKQLNQDHWYHLMAGEDERGGGALLFFNLSRPLELAGSQREHPSPVEFLKQAKRLGAHVDIEKPFWWDAPIWLASGLADSIGLAHNHMLREGVLDNEAWGKPRDTKFFPPPDGNGRWSREIYHHALNCGLRIAPSAGSASGVLPNPVGYNRVYVHVEGEFTWEKWWQGLKQGRVFVTNGPLLRCRVQDQYPGHVFSGAESGKLVLQAQVDLATRDRIEYLEVVKDGKVVHEVRLDEYAKAGGFLPGVEFEQSGWMMIRAVASVADTYRFACSGPFYVQLGEQPRISRLSAQFFIDWVDERMAAIQVPQEHRDGVLLYHRAARKFWQEKLDQANAP